MTKPRKNLNSCNRHKMPVHFEFRHPTATTVCIAGTFNDWQPTTTPMHSAGFCHWQREMNLKPGTYEYCLVVDGHWMTDPQAQATQPNPFGGRNSVLVVANSPEAAHRADATNLPLRNSNIQEPWKAQGPDRSA